PRSPGTGVTARAEVGAPFRPGQRRLARSTARRSALSAEPPPPERRGAPLVDTDGRRRPATDPDRNHRVDTVEQRAHPELGVGDGVDRCRPGRDGGRPPDPPGRSTAGAGIGTIWAKGR